ncbi:MAG TPA: PQQ-dependent sugar dehydrogenase [Solirubrobacterales bacterium]|nr:PQQ-dependent sugar dehydrogenase [Solirubrobacterales bacterium]
MPTALAFAPSGQVFVAEHQGRILVFDGLGDDTPAVFADIRAKVHHYEDRGILGLKLDPDFPAKPYVYVSYTHDAPIGGTAPVHGGAGEFDGCPDPADGDCVVSGRVSRFEYDPGTGLAKTSSGGQPAEQVLVESWCQQFPSHSTGDIEFRPGTRQLYASGGDGASFQVADYGQLDGNPCGDPANEGGALRSQDIRTPATAADPTDYGGALLRIDPDTGAALADNPGILSTDAAARRILAYGFRNPFRFEFRPGSGDLYVQDTGWKLWEELDRIPDATAVRNFGWPCYEGASKQPEYDALDLGLCESLYSAPSQVAAPFFYYGNQGKLFDADDCPTDAGAASSGLAFYQGADFPDPYTGALFMANSARGCIWVMYPNADGIPDPGNIELFAFSDFLGFTPVDLVVGPDGYLYAADFFNNRIVRFRYSGPVADLAADKTFGLTPLTVNFDASGSSDADDEPLLYEWDFDGDGFDDGSGSDPAVQHTYTNGTSNVTARVRVSDSETSDVAQLTLYPGDRPPAPSITSPSAALRWTVGDRIDYSGGATDPDQVSVAPSALDWDVQIQHCRQTCHTHPLTSARGTATGSFNGPEHEYGSYVTIELTATDARGLSATSAPLRLDPRTVTLTLRSSPAGIALTRDDETRAGPFTVPMAAGAHANVIAPASATLGGIEYLFSGWSDGGARVHAVSPTENTDLTASYAGPGEPPPPSTALLRIASRPPGMLIRVDDTGRRTPFSRLYEKGSRVRLAAPRRVRQRGRLLRFQRWSNGGARVQKVLVQRAARYVARYAAQP